MIRRRRPGRGQQPGRSSPAGREARAGAGSRERSERSPDTGSDTRRRRTSTPHHGSPVVLDRHATSPGSAAALPFAQASTILLARSPPAWAGRAAGPPRTAGPHRAAARCATGSRARHHARRARRWRRGQPTNRASSAAAFSARCSRRSSRVALTGFRRYSCPAEVSRSQGARSFPRSRDRPAPMS